MARTCRWKLNFSRTKSEVKGLKVLEFISVNFPVILLSFFLREFCLNWCDSWTLRKLLKKESRKVTNFLGVSSWTFRGIVFENMGNYWIWQLKTWYESRQSSLKIHENLVEFPVRFSLQTNTESETGFSWWPEWFQSQVWLLIICTFNGKKSTKILIT